MRALSSRPFCPCGGRRVSLRYLSAVGRYTARYFYLLESTDCFNTTAELPPLPDCAPPPWSASRRVARPPCSLQDRCGCGHTSCTRPPRSRTQTPRGHTARRSAETHETSMALPHRSPTCVCGHDASTSAHV